MKFFIKIGLALSFFLSICRPVDASCRAELELIFEFLKDTEKMVFADKVWGVEDVIDREEIREHFLAASWFFYQMARDPDARLVWQKMRRRYSFVDPGAEAIAQMTDRLVRLKGNDEGRRQRFFLPYLDIEVSRATLLVMEAYLQELRAAEAGKGSE